jgi:hypothetical protein
MDVKAAGQHARGQRARDRPLMLLVGDFQLCDPGGGRATHKGGVVRALLHAAAVPQPGRPLALEEVAVAKVARARARAPPAREAAGVHAAARVRLRARALEAALHQLRARRAGVP